MFINGIKIFDNVKFETNLEIIITFLRSHSEITELNMSKCYDSEYCKVLSGNQKVELFLTLLRVETLSNLNFSQNAFTDINDTMFDQITDGLRKTRIAQLDLSSCFLCLSVIPRMKLLLALLKNPMIVKLNFNNNDPFERDQLSFRRDVKLERDAKINEIAEGFSKTQVTCLNLAHMDGFAAQLSQEETMKILLAIFNNPKIVSLDFSNIPLFVGSLLSCDYIDTREDHKKDCAIVAATLALSKIQLTHLSLSSCFQISRYSYLGGILFLELLKNPKIISLDFSYNYSVDFFRDNRNVKVDPTIFTQLCEALTTTTISELNLSSFLSLEYIYNDDINIKIWSALFKNSAIVKLEFNGKKDSFFDIYALLSCKNYLPPYRGFLLELEVIDIINSREIIINEIAKMLATTKIACLNFLNLFNLILPEVWMKKTCLDSDKIRLIFFRQKIKLLLALFKNPNLTSLEISNDDHEIIMNISTGVRQLLIEKLTLNPVLVIKELYDHKKFFLSLVAKATSSASMLLFSNMGKKLCDDVWENIFEFANRSDKCMVKERYINILTMLNEKRRVNNEKQISKIKFGWINRSISDETIDSRCRNVL